MKSKTSRKVEHTPIPYSVREFTIESGRSGGFRLYGTLLGKPFPIGVIFPLDHQMTDEAIANKDFILRACNSHEALIEACKMALKILEPMDSAREPGDGDIDEIGLLKQALKLAGAL